MKLALCIASRGNPEQLAYVIRECDANLADPDNTVISVALDDDDASNAAPPPTRSELLWSIAAREDSLGAKYNRCQRNASADAYVLGADDNAFLTPGWDDRIRERFAEFEQDFGFCYFGRLDGTLPINMAVSHRLIAEQGFMFPEQFPFWFYDNWIDEIAHLTGRIVWADIKVEEIGGRGRTRGLRDIVFWTELYEALRPDRLALADALSARYNPPWLQTQLRQRRTMLLNIFMNRNEKLRNPATAVHFEKRMSHDAPEDERYARIKAKGEALLARLRAHVPEAVG